MNVRKTHDFIQGWSREIRQVFHSKSIFYCIRALIIEVILDNVNGLTNTSSLPIPSDFTLLLISVNGDVVVRTIL